MNKKVIIGCDSTCDLGKDITERYNIKVQPLFVNLGEEQYLDGVDITPDMIYERYEESGILPKTAAPSIADMEDFFAKHTSGGNAMVFFTISSEMSSTFAHAKLASESFEDVYVVDTKNLSSGGGLLVLSAVDMAENGVCARDIAKECERLIPYVDASFVIDDLEFLHKGGRCSAVAAFGANLLQLKPCIAVSEGKMSVGKKYRGKFPLTLGKYIEDRLGDGSGIILDRVFVTHAGCDAEIYESCLEKVKSIAPFKEVLLARAGCTISSHCGRNTLGVLFIRKPEDK